MKKVFFTLFLLFFSVQALAQNAIVGFWTTIDDETKQPKSVVQIYEYNGQYYGRVVDIFKNKEAKANIKGSPLIIGLDIIWNLKKEGSKYTGGKILDPQKGKVYGCEIWRDDKKLIVRGKIAFLGRNQTWLPNSDFKPQDNSDLIPKIPK